MTKVSNMTLPELYESAESKGKATPSIFARISQLEDFRENSKVDARYCGSVCQIPSACKEPGLHQTLLVNPEQRGGVVILFHSKPKWYRDKKALETIVSYMADRAFPGIPYKILYAVRCKPTEDQKKDYSITQMKACANFLRADLAKLQPRAIILTSTMAAKALGLKYGQKTHLSRFFWPFEGAPETAVLMTLNPLVTTMIRQNASGAYWGNDFFHLIFHDFKKAGMLCRGEIPRRTVAEAIAEIKQQDRIQVTRSIEQVAQACAFIRSLPNNPVISWDTETTGLDPWAPDARFLMHQFGYTYEGQTHAVVIPLWHRENTLYDPNEAWEHVKGVLEDPYLTKVGHNGKFDLKYTRVVTGVEVQNYVFDTMYALHSICSGLQGSGTYTLKKAVWDYLPESGLGGYDDNLQFEVSEDEEDSEEENATE